MKDGAVRACYLMGALFQWTPHVERSLSKLMYRGKKKDKDQRLLGNLKISQRAEQSRAEQISSNRLSANGDSD